MKKANNRLSYENYPMKNPQSKSLPYDSLSPEILEFEFSYDCHPMENCPGYPLPPENKCLNRHRGGFPYLTTVVYSKKMFLLKSAKAQLISTIAKKTLSGCIRYSIALFYLIMKLPYPSLCFTKPTSTTARKQKSYYENQSGQ